MIQQKTCCKQQQYTELPLSRRTTYITSNISLRTPKFDIKGVPQTSENFYVRPKIYIEMSNHANIPTTLDGFLDVCPTFLTAFHVSCVQRNSHFLLACFILTVRCHMVAYVYSVNVFSNLLGVYTIK